MSHELMAGILGAWCLAQLALGAFFLLVYALGRREGDYLVFGLLCFALALTTGGVVFGTLHGTLPNWRWASDVAHAGAILACATNLHFALRHGAPGLSRRAALPIYGVALAFELVVAFDVWWRPGTARVFDREVWGHVYHFGTAEPTLFGVAFYVLAGLQLLANQILFWRAARKGDSAALIAFVGGLGVCATGLNDILVVLGFQREMLILLPHAFMLYAFAVGLTLVLRYRATAGELREAEDSLRRTAEELRVSHLELEQAQDELSTKAELAAVGELAAAIAHEVRNPLAIIMNASASLRRIQVEGKDRQMLLDIVDEESARLNRLVTDLLRFARPAKVRQSPVDLREIAERARPPGSAQHRIDVEISEDAPSHVAGDATLLRVALENLLDNACQATPTERGMKISISRIQQDSRHFVRIAVVDEGSGMDAATLGRALDPFFTTRPSGTGLGLPIVQRIVRAHGGSLELESEVGAGTSAVVLLPEIPIEVRAPEPALEPSSRPAVMG